MAPCLLARKEETDTLMLRGCHNVWMHSSKNLQWTASLLSAEKKSRLRLANQISSPTLPQSQFSGTSRLRSESLQVNLKVLGSNPKPEPFLALPMIVCLLWHCRLQRLRSTPLLRGLPWLQYRSHLLSSSWALWVVSYFWMALSSSQK